MMLTSLEAPIHEQYFTLSGFSGVNSFSGVRVMVNSQDRRLITKLRLRPPSLFSLFPLPCFSSLSLFHSSPSITHYPTGIFHLLSLALRLDTCQQYTNFIAQLLRTLRSQPNVLFDIMDDIESMVTAYAGHLEIDSSDHAVVEFERRYIWQQPSSYQKLLRYVDEENRQLA